MDAEVLRLDTHIRHDAGQAEMQRLAAAAGPFTRHVA
jgi:hypothetical protein